MVVRNIRHSGIVTKSIESSLEFYCGVLGFEKAPVVEEKGKALETMLGLENGVVKTCKLGTKDGGAKLELLEFLNPMSENKVVAGLTHLGLTHFAITVEDIQSVYEKVQEMGLETISSPVKTDGGPQVMFIRDVNNVLIEIVQE